MGIKDLNKILASVNAVVNSKYNSPLLTQTYKIFCKETEGVTDFICHIDFSLLLYRYLYTFNTMEEVYQNLKKRIFELKKNNNRLLIYLEPSGNTRKAETHKERMISHTKTKNQIRQSIQTEIDLYNRFKPDDSSSLLNTDLLDAIGFNDEEKEIKITNEEYSRRINLLNSKPAFYTERPVLPPPSLDDPQLSFLNHGFRPVESDEVLTEAESLEVLKKDKNEYNEIKNDQQLFHYFLFQVPMYVHHKYLKERLLKEGVIHTSELITSSSFDAEVNIVYTIKRYYQNQKNLIVSIDQDCILFALLHQTGNYIYLKTSVGINPDDITIIKNDHFTRNIAILCAFCNKTDYFKGVRNLGITTKRLNDFCLTTSIFSHKLNLFQVVACFLDWFVSNKKKPIPPSNRSIDYMHSYFNNFQSYLNLDENFYYSDIHFDRLEIEDLHWYFTLTNMTIPLALPNSKVLSSKPYGIN